MIKIIALSLALCTIASFASSGINSGFIPQDPTSGKEEVKKPIQGMFIINEFYAVDEKFVYVTNSTKNGWVKFEADRPTFEVLGGQFAGDITSIYQRGKILEGVRRENFSIISSQEGYARDSLHVYGPQGIIIDSDPTTFRVLSHNYALDAGRVYFGGKVILGANAGSFQIISDASYARDDSSVYYEGKKLEGVSSVGFTAKGHRGVAQDGSVFEYGKKVSSGNPLDPKEETETSVWDFIKPLTTWFTKNVVFGSILILAIIAGMSMLFHFFALRNDLRVSFGKSFLKIVIAGVVFFVALWLLSYFLGPVQALIASIIVSLFFYISLWSALGWIKSFIVSLLSLIGVIFIGTLVYLILRGIFGENIQIMQYLSTPHAQLCVLLGILGIFIGTFLIHWQLRSGIIQAFLQSVMATGVALGILGFFSWILGINTVLFVIFFALFWTVLVWIMRFRMASELFVETVKIVRVGVILFVIVTLFVWIIL